MELTLQSFIGWYQYQADSRHNPCFYGINFAMLVKLHVLL